MGAPRTSIAPHKTSSARRWHPSWRAIGLEPIVPPPRPVPQLIGQFTTFHPCCESRVTNIHLMAATIDGMVVSPGESFSINATVGERTSGKGYVPAPAIIGGEVYCCDHPANIGGGVSQVATTLFNAVFFAGLEDVFHQPHSLYISRYPMGREATLRWTAPDLVFRNDTSTPVTIDMSYSDTSLTATLYGDNEGRQVRNGLAGTATPEGGGTVTVYRYITYLDGETILGWTWTYQAPANGLVLPSDRAATPIGLALHSGPAAVRDVPTTRSSRSSPHDLQHLSRPAPLRPVPLSGWRLSASNAGTFVQTVAASWLMQELTGSHLGGGHGASGASSLPRLPVGHSPTSSIGGRVMLASQVVMGIAATVSQRSPSSSCSTHRSCLGWGCCSEWGSPSTSPHGRPWFPTSSPQLVANAVAHQLRGVQRGAAVGPALGGLLVACRRRDGPFHQQPLLWR